MCSILLPVDGSDNSSRAVQLVIRLHSRLAPLKVRLLHVQVPLVRIANEPARRESPELAAEQAFAPAKALLDAAGIPYTSEVASGYVGSTIVAQAREHGCEGIVMGTRGMGSSEQLLGSIARQVIQFAEIPVTLVK